MKAEKVETFEVNLKLSKEEALWLMGNMQNPLHGQDVIEETDSDSIIRHKFFDTLKNILGN